MQSHLQQKYLKTQIQSYSDEATDFHAKKIAKACSTSNINYVLKKAKNYYPQVFSEECDYIKKEKKVIRYITDDLKSSDDDSDVSHDE